MDILKHAHGSLVVRGLLHHFANQAVKTLKDLSPTNVLDYIQQEMECLVRDIQNCGGFDLVLEKLSIPFSQDETPSHDYITAVLFVDENDVPQRMMFRGDKPTLAKYVTEGYHQLSDAQMESCTYDKAAAGAMSKRLVEIMRNARSGEMWIPQHRVLFTVTDRHTGAIVGVELCRAGEDSVYHEREYDFLHHLFVHRHYGFREGPWNTILRKQRHVIYENMYALSKICEVYADRLLEADMATLCDIAAEVTDKRKVAVRFPADIIQFKKCTLSCNEQSRRFELDRKRTTAFALAFRLINTVDGEHTIGTNPIYVTVSEPDQCYTHLQQNNKERVLTMCRDALTIV